MNKLVLEAFAKVNLGLDVVRRLENGYHEVSMVMQTVGISDRISMEKTASGITVTSDSEEAPADEHNLVYRAARLVKEEYGIEEGVSIDLQKRIPVAAGMAGGSTDAAAVIKGMNSLFGLGLSLTRMQELGVRLGADIPYCILGGTALAEGIGERLTSLPDMPHVYFLIAKPKISVSTKYVYENLRLDEHIRHPDIRGMAQAVQSGSLEGILSRMGNVLESVTEQKYAVIGRLKRFMEAHGARRALMSGSGPAVFGIYEAKEEAEAAKKALEREEPTVSLFVVTDVSRLDAMKEREDAG